MAGSMFRWKAFILLATMICSAAAHAQDPPPGRWWRSPDIVQALQLAGSEVQQLEEAFETSRLKMIRLKSRVETEQFKLQRMVEKRDIDEATIKAQHRRLESARSALADERFSFFVKARSIIGYDRFQKLLNMAPGKGEGRDW